ncbi:unnamed protein product [Diamesa hyperborea]
MNKLSCLLVIYCVILSFIEEAQGDKSIVVYIKDQSKRNSDIMSVEVNEELFMDILAQVDLKNKRALPVNNINSANDFINMVSGENCKCQCLCCDTRVMTTPTTTQTTPTTPTTPITQTTPTTRNTTALFVPSTYLPPTRGSTTQRPSTTTRTYHFVPVTHAAEQTDDIEEVQPEVPEVIINEFSDSHVLDQSIEKGNLIYKNNNLDEGMKNDLHQSEFKKSDWNESQESIKPNYDYENYNQENQPNAQPYYDPDQIGLTDEYLDGQPQEINFQQQEQYSTDNPYPNKSSDNQQPDYVEENIDENKLPNSEFSTVNTTEQDENNYNNYNQQLDSNQHYQTEQQPSNNDYANDPSANYDYDQTPQIIYDDQEQQQQEQQQQYNEYTAVENQDNFNSNAYNNEMEFNNEVLDDENKTQFMTLPDNDGNKNGGDILEHEQPVPQSNDILKSTTNYEVETVHDGSILRDDDGDGETTDIDETTITTSTSTSESIEKQKKSLDIENENENETKSNANEPIDNVAVVDESGMNALYETQQDDVKMVKQLLDSESDDNSVKSNLKQLANDEKENVDESDFDFSTS